MSSTKSKEVVASLKNELLVKKNIPKKVVMKKLKKCKKQLLENSQNTIQDLDMNLDIKDALAVEFPRKTPGIRDTPKVQQRREDMVTLIQQLIDQMENKNDQILVVKVNTPAVDLNRSFNSEELEFMKEDIFKGIKGQVESGLISNEVEDQWKDAFEAMISIVDIEKQNSLQ